MHCSPRLSLSTVVFGLALLSLSACGGSSPPPTRTEASLVLHVPCVTPPCTGDAPEPPPPITAGRRPVSMLALGRAHSCALTEDGVVHCWGDNQRGQLGETGMRESDTPAPVPSLPPMAAVWSGYDATCARTSDDAQLFCWGNTGLGDAGRQGAVNALPFEGVRYVALADQRGCFLTEAGELYCWGRYPPPAGPRWDGPQRVRIPGGVRAVSLGWVRGCAAGGNGRLTCWGQQPVYIDIDSVPRTDRMWTYSELHEAAEVAFNEQVQALPVVLSEQGRLYQVEVGEGHGHGAEHHLGRRVFDIDGTVQLTAGANHHCARTSAGDAYCWGSNRHGQVGDGSNAPNRDEPRPLDLEGVQEIAAGGKHSCARTDAEVYCWGDNQ
ncbi:MAG: RCC1 domain-containing protein, partial [Sandaracinaceae bacterium]